MLDSVSIRQQDLTVFGIGMLAAGAWFTPAGIYIETATLAALTS